MSSTTPKTSANNSTASSVYRVNYSEYVADITGGSSKTARKIPTAGIGHHINPLNNPYPNQTNQPTQQTGGMPQYGGGTEKCARCSKSVYLAERKLGASRAFHSSCFSCYTCKRKLDATTLSEHKGEIYCKSCYTKQYGPHGLASGVTMSTEKSVTRESRPIRRSSFGDDLDPTVSSYQQMRQRAISNENLFRGTDSSTKTDEFSSRYPRYDDSKPRPISPSTKRDNGIGAIVDIRNQRPTTPTRVDKFIESNTNNNSHRSTYIEEDDRRKYIKEGEKVSYGTGTSKIVDIPVIVNPKRPDSIINQTEAPIDPTRDSQRSHSPSIASNGSYRRQSSHERQTDVTDDNSHLYINTDNSDKNNRKYSNDYTINSIASGSTATTGGYYHAPSYENIYRSTTSNSTDRRSPSPQTNNRPAPGVDEFISQTNIVGNTPSSTGNQYSAISSLVMSGRQRNTQNSDNDDFDN
ncbi:unnamed protein product [Rotaria magnacalcarata]|uniref:LIM zinc-binding domain-containing protein n=1 Tax=Rotaria magnacalcarata TaxID=392030 RepID=A0A816T5M8_9BILA|nr:unnamed protein product [Rotaria magnacalcarata]CAF3959487.1 unnamed protein product [Rotaria magnacalcarata]